MLTRLIFCFTILLPIALFAADKPTMLNVKEGLWEITVTHSAGGMGIPDDMLAKMPPDQRARVEEMMKQKGISMSGNTTVVKSCVTKEKIEKGMAFGTDNRENCTRSVVKSSPSHFEAKYHCEESKKDGNKTMIDGTTTVDVVDRDNTKGTAHTVRNSEGHEMTIDMTFTSKYLGPACGDVK